jgi:hypothetical protein
MDDADLLSKIVEKMADRDSVQRIAELLSASRAIVKNATLNDSVTCYEIEAHLIDELRKKILYFEGINDAH